jgi:hypothetical protein
MPQTAWPLWSIVWVYIIKKNKKSSDLESRKDTGRSELKWCSTMSRFNSMNACYHSAQNILYSHLPRNVKIKMYKPIKLPAVLYGCETWSLALREQHSLRVFQNRVLPQNWHGSCGEEKKWFLCWDSNPGHPACSLCPNDSSRSPKKPQTGVSLCIQFLHKHMGTITKSVSVDADNIVRVSGR